MKNTMDDLRNHLFETLEALKDEEKPMEIDRALAIANVADKLIETAKVEVQFLKVTGASDEGSFAAPKAKQLSAGGTNGDAKRP